ncbi:MAG: S-layer homology domain-containing protein [Clostridia bacterium]|nr:S-layer homology domain-containing protein [Clostridia bacterium]
MKLRRTVSILLCVLLALSICPFAVADTVIEISDAADLDNIRNNLSGNYILTADITLTEDFFPIGLKLNNQGTGYQAVAFTGTLDGNGHTISGLSVTVDENTDKPFFYIGLFADNDGTIKNLIIDNATFTANVNTTVSAVNVGFFAATCAGTVQNCAVTRSAAQISVDTVIYAGGIAGYHTGRIIDCYFDGTLSATALNGNVINVGGIAGRSYSTESLLQTSLSVGTVTGDICSDDENKIATNQRVGDIAGYISGKVNYVYAKKNNTLAVGQNSAGTADRNQNVFAQLTTQELKTYESFETFDFTNIWLMKADHPALQITHTHTAGDWQIVTQPTYLKKGLREQCCQSCGATLSTKSITKLQGKDVSNVFTDIKKSDWYYKNDSIYYAYNQGLFNGTTKNTFAPEMGMDRAMFVTVLGRLYGADTRKGGITKFEDVDPDHYYAPYVKWASEGGIVNGISETEFNPTDKITREQICAMLIRYCDFADITLQKSNATIPFIDQSSVSPYAKKAVSACQRAGLINGEKVGQGYRFHPVNNASRAEVATIMLNFAKKYL